MPDFGKLLVAAGIALAAISIVDTVAPQYTGWVVLIMLLSIAITHKDFAAQFDAVFQPLLNPHLDPQGGSN